jgi:hypothetical protein
MLKSISIFFSEIKLEEAAILHYTYTKFSDLTSRRDRCGCKPTKDDVKRCFILEFDRLVSVFCPPCKSRGTFYSVSNNFNLVIFHY